MVAIIYYLLQEAFRDAMTAHSAQLTKMRLPDRAVMLKAVSKAKNPILVKRKKMFKLGLARDSFFIQFATVCICVPRHHLIPDYLQRSCPSDYIYCYTYTMHS